MVGGVEGRMGSRKEVDSASDMMEWVKTLELYVHHVQCCHAVEEMLLNMLCRSDTT